MDALVGRERAFTLIEVACAFAVLVVIAGAVLVGGRGHLASIGDSFDELAASRQAASLLERPGRLEPGESTFEVDQEMLPGATGRRTVVERAPGLYEVTVTIEYGRERTFRLTTLEEARR